MSSSVVIVVVAVVIVAVVVAFVVTNVVVVSSSVALVSVEFEDVATGIAISFVTVVAFATSFCAFSKYTERAGGSSIVFALERTVIVVPPSTAPVATTIETISFNKKFHILLFIFQIGIVSIIHYLFCYVNINIEKSLIYIRLFFLCHFI